MSEVRQKAKSREVLKTILALLQAGWKSREGSGWE